MKTKIVLIFYNKWQMTHSLLWSLYKHEKRNVDCVYLVNNGSTDEEVAGGLKWWGWDSGMKVDVVSLVPNIGFLLGSNVGLEKAIKNSDPDDLIILLSNDVQIKGQFIQQMKDLLAESPKSLLGGVLYAQDTGWNKFEDKVFPYLEGWILGTLAKNWIELGGGFDEQYAPNDFEDVDLSTTALSLGYELLALNNPNLVHLGGQTLGFSPERAELTKVNQKKFEGKWLIK